MEFSELRIRTDSCRSYVLQLPTSVIYGMLFKNTVYCIGKDLATVFSYAANCICKQHTIDNTAGRKQSHMTITSVHLTNASL